MQISIPYGAIKRTLLIDDEEIETLISIPYGAIKSYKWQDVRKMFEHFNSLWCN